MTQFRIPELGLIVLQEMFLTGYTVDAQAVAHRGTEALAWMREMSRREDCAVCGTAAVEENNLYHNRMYFVRPYGAVTQYDKRHLFSFAGEDRTFTAGTERVVVEWCGVRILLLTCYDLRFPVFSRQNASQRGDDQGAEYDLIVYSADWPESRIDAWDILLKARAVENVCYVVGANLIHSQLIDYKGHPAQKIDLDALRKFREKFPVLKDADRFELKF